MIERRRTVFHSCSRAALLGAVAAACGGSDLALPSAAPAALEAVAGQNQTGTVGVPLPDSLVVRVTDAEGAGLAGVRVSWSANGGGSVAPATSTTDADGLAATQRILGATPGAYGTSATAPGTEGSPAVFLATAGAGAPNAGGSKVEVASATLTASTGSSATAVTVTVRDGLGNPVSGVDIKLSATGSGNKIMQPSASTNAEGVATGRLSATGAGAHVVTASADGVKIGQTATIVVLPAPPDEDKSAVIVRDGTAGASTLVTVRLRDQFGNKVSGASSKLAVSVTGVNPKPALSISEGDDAEYAAQYTPTVAGADLVQIAFDGAAALGGPFRSTVAPGPAVPSMTIAVVDGVATLFSPVADVSLQARDAFGNPTRRANENVSVTAIFDGERRGIHLTYDADTGAYVGSFRPWDFGEFKIEILVNGVPISGSPFTTVMRTF